MDVAKILMAVFLVIAAVAALYSATDSVWSDTSEKTGNQADLSIKINECLQQNRGASYDACKCKVENPDKSFAECSS